MNDWISHSYVRTAKDRFVCLSRVVFEAKLKLISQLIRVLLFDERLCLKQNIRLFSEHLESLCEIGILEFY